MHSSRPDRPGQPALRRRIPLELTAEELELLERAEAEHGTKRASLVAGLTALSRLNEIERQLDEALKACGETDQERARLLERLGESEAALAKAQASASNAKAKGSTAERRRGDTLVAAEAREVQLRRTLALAQADVQDAEERIEELSGRAVDSLPCARCKEWVRPDGWEIQEGEDGVYLYHRSCGLHKGGLSGGHSLLGFRER